MSTKKEIRKSVLEKRDKLTLDERLQKSQNITEIVLSSEEFQSSDELLLFASYKSEVDTTEIIKQALGMDKRVYLPKVQGKEMIFYQINSMEELKEGYCGIREPEAELSRQFTPKQDRKVFVLMPGVAFDKMGGRIGYGGGFYDKFLSKIEVEIPRENLCKMAVAFECQLVENGKIIKEEYDIKPNCIMTEEKIYSVAH